MREVEKDIQCFGDFEGPIGKNFFGEIPIKILDNFICSSLLSKFTVSDIFQP